MNNNFNFQKNDNQYHDLYSNIDFSQFDDLGNTKKKRQKKNLDTVIEKKQSSMPKYNDFDLFNDLEKEFELQSSKNQKKVLHKKKPSLQAQRFITTLSNMQENKKKDSKLKLIVSKMKFFIETRKNKKRSIKRTCNKQSEKLNNADMFEDLYTNFLEKNNCTNQNYTRKTSYTDTENTPLLDNHNTRNSNGTKLHIIIDKKEALNTNYYLLDSNLNVVETKSVNNIKTFFLRKHNLKAFKKQIKKDKASYLANCKIKNIIPDKDFIDMHRKINFYLFLCPDADYQILELIRNNITNLNTSYSNYQSACAEYLHELACLSSGNPDAMPFDINYCLDEPISNNHKYISQEIGFCNNPVQAFISFQKNEYSDFRSEIHCNPSIFTPKFSQTHTKSAHNRDICR